MCHEEFEETAKFQDYSSIEKNYWNQKLTTMEKLPIFDDGDNEELEHDVHSFVDKTTHLTSAVLRRGVEMSVNAVTTILYRPP